MAGQANNLKVQLSEVEVRIEGLITRTAEELNLDLPASFAQYTHDETRDWEGVRLEIADLRGKIERLGNVNLDAIAEQDELAKRDEFLAAQIEDIRSSQRQLSELIRRINAESRRRFEESFESVRANFNELFRKLFGGGKADIILTNPEDVLESGIEVLARPPGKEPGSIMLLSGGEKTMTALALLFSFFKARPSPFLMLDEVDAALDEANTERFVKLVREFLTISQFVIISHSKRTIAMADQIYGITMQEPGVSTKVSVRFEEAQRLAAAPKAQTVVA
jgi:chromosome segregation protein